jgi:hypothetical protein
VPGADGLQTGHTEEAGYGLTASAKRGERRLILVFNGLPTMRARAEESERLLEWGFREFENVSLFRAGETVEEVPVYLGDRRTVPLVGARDVVVTLPRQWRRNLQARLRYDAPVAAPVAKGRELGGWRCPARACRPCRCRCWPAPTSTGWGSFRASRRCSNTSSLRARAGLSPASCPATPRRSSAARGRHAERGGASWTPP